MKKDDVDFSVKEVRERIKKEVKELIEENEKLPLLF